MKELISVVLPVYNVELYIEETINSLLNQTYKNIEIIVVDDFSTDQTVSVVENSYKNEPKVKLFKNKENKKIAETLNYGIQKSRGKFIARIDGDDISVVDRLERQLDFLMKNDDIDIVGCGVESFDNTGIISVSYYPNDPYLLKKISKYSSPIKHIWMCEKEVYNKVGGYRFSSVEDYDFLLRAIDKGMKITSIPNYIGMKIRIREGNTVSLFGIKQRILVSHIQKLHKERVIYGNEVTNEIRIDESSFSYKIKNHLHNISNLFLSRGLASKYTSVKSIFVVISMLISTYQAKYIYSRLRERMMLRNSFNSNNAEI
ncbi:Glyco_trans_2-like domain-containing protein [Vibrio chagasii]|nr:Glyco_trans_2-like domain-containing protein [Vibrio chagasii]CAH6942728.1 Glyco_trans_2-like domain-containing protein [Vibrio chagasii]CAH6944790.1 Glyco_trans_2-like domain-containing protein [Vibrio chagasii]